MRQERQLRAAHSRPAVLRVDSVWAVTGPSGPVLPQDGLSGLQPWSLRDRTRRRYIKIFKNKNKGRNVAGKICWRESTAAGTVLQVQRARRRVLVGLQNSTAERLQASILQQHDDDDDDNDDDNGLESCDDEEEQKQEEEQEEEEEEQ